jgi:transposase
MTQRRGPRAYTDEFRREAVRLAEAGTMPLARIARELGITVHTLRSWRRQAALRSDAAAADAELPESGPRTVPALEAELRRLRRENARLLEEREILKKATAFFAKDAR